MTKLEIRQIYYNKKTFSQVPHNFIPLNNISGDKSWFEFWPILKFLEGRELEENTFYGFFSPKFYLKTGFLSEDTIALIRANKNKDVILFSSDIDQLSFFINQWEQGEIYHQGITKVTQDFLDHSGVKIRISELVTSTKNSVNSNFIIAKKNYWEKWKSLANQFMQYADNTQNNIFYMKVRHRKIKLPMKVFIQERLPSLILADGSFSTLAIKPKNSFFSASYFVKSIENKKNLEACDEIKNLIIKNNPNKNLIKEFKKTRERILLKKDAQKIINSFKNPNKLIDYQVLQDKHIMKGLGQYVIYKFKKNKGKRILSRLIKICPKFIQNLLIYFAFIFH